MLTPEEKKQHLVESGFDPSQYDLVDQGDSYRIVQTNNISPSVSPQTTEQAVALPEVSAMGSFGRKAAEGILPAVSGSAAAYGISKLLGPEVSLPVQVLGPLIGGMATSMGTAMGQQAVIDQVAPNYKFYQQQDQALHPYMSKAGSVTAMLAGGMSPNPMNVLAAGKTLANPNLYMGKALAPELNNLMNVGLGATVPLAVPVGSAALHQIDPSMGAPLPPIHELLGEMALGGLMNKPNALGVKYLGMHPQTGPIETYQERQNADALKYQQMMQDADATQLSSANPEVAKKQEKSAFNNINPDEPLNLPDKMARYKQSLEPVEPQISAMENEGNVLANQHAEELMAEQTAAQVAQHNAQLEQQRLAASDATRQAKLLEVQRGQVEAETQSLEDQLKAGQITPNTTPRPNFPEHQLPSRELPQVSPEESAADLEMRRLEGNNDRFQQAEQETVGDGNVVDKESETKLPARQVSALNSIFTTLGKDRGVQLNPVGKIVNKHGVEVNGMATAREGIKDAMAYVNQEKPDTWPHELLHPFMADLRASTNPNDVAFLAKMEEAVSSSPRFKEINDKRAVEGKEAWDAEEFLASRGGETYADRLTKNDPSGKDSVWKDLWSKLKVKYGNPFYDDAVRLLNYKMANDAPFNAADINARPNAVGQREQEGATEPASEKDADYKFEHDLSEFAPNKGIVKFYNLKKDLVDPVSGEIKHGVGSTVSEETLKKFGVTKYQEAGDEVVGPEVTKEEAKPIERASMANPLTSVYDRVEQKFKDNPDSKVREIATKVTQQLKKFSGEKDYLEGQFGNKLIGATKDYSPTEIQRVYKHLYQRDDTGFSSVALSEKEQQLAKNITEILRDPKTQQKALGLMVKRGDQYRVAGMKKDGYMFNVLNPEVAYEWANNFDSAKSREYDKLYLDHAKKKGIGPDEAKQLLSVYKAQMANRNVGGDQTVDYGPIRKAEGIGLPFELAEQNFNAAASMYAKRAAKDLAFYKHLQSQPDIRHALMLKDQFGKIPEQTDMPEVPRIGTDEVVQDALKSVTGANKIENPRLMATARLVANGVMGVGTAAKNVASLPVTAMPHMQLDQIPLMAKALLGHKESAGRAFESGAVKSNFGDFEQAGLYEGNPDPYIRLVNKASQFLRKYQGRDLSDKFEGEVLFSLGELMIPSTIEKAKAGNKDSLRLLNRMSDLVEGGSDAILKGKELTTDDQQRMAKRFVDITRGTYGPEGLPQWAMEGPAAPFAALSRFSIEKSNAVQKDVINPIVRDGNFAPLLKTALTALGVGAGIEGLNELLNHRKANEPTMKEVAEVGNADDVAAKAISLLQLASFGGVASDIAKAGLNAYQGKVKINNPISFPLQTFVTDTLYGNLSDAADAVSKGEDKFQVITKLIGDIASQSIQSLRYLKNNTISADDMEEADKRRDLRTFEEMSGKGKTTPNASANPYLGMDEKKFKKTTNLEEAQALLPDIVKKYATQYHDDPVTLLEKLNGLKHGMNDQAMPNYDKKPDEFVKYVEFLLKTQGKDKARQAVVDYKLHEAASQAKAKMIP